MKLIPKYKEPWGKLTLNEFISDKINEVRNNAYKKSLERTLPKVPITVDAIKTELEWLNSLKVREAEAKRLPIFGDIILKGIQDERNLGYTNYLKKCYGSSCTATGFDNYNKNITSGALFKENPNKYGFQEVPYNKKKSGDIILINKSNGTPHHTMMYSTTSNGLDLFNHSNGGYDEEAIRKNAKYPIKLGEFPTSYTFIGTPQDSVKWINEYKLKYN